MQMGTRYGLLLIGVVVALAGCDWATSSPAELRIDTDTVELTPTSPSTDAASAGPDGELLIVSVDGGLWSIRADGSDPHVLVSPQADELGCRRSCTFIYGPLFRYAAWSPDGSRIAFVHAAAGPGPSHGRPKIYVVNSDGSDLRLLGACPAPGRSECDMFDGSSLSWSPDGTQLAVSDDGGIYVVDVATGDSQRVQLGTTPSWSPDGWIAYFRVATSHGARVPEPGLYIVRPNGSDERLVAAQRDPSGQPRWSPDSSQILFSAPGGIQVVSADGSGRRRLVDLQRGEGSGAPSWSPDGTRIAFAKSPGSRLASRPEVWTIGVDGQDEQRVYAGECCVFDAEPTQPVWSPDGSALAFSISVDDRVARGLYVADADGTAVRRVFSWGAAPIWRPEP